MKKFISLLLAFVFVSLSVVSVSAATRQDVLDLANEKIPAKYETYHIWAENILGQYDLDEAEWDEVLALLQSVVATFPEDEGQSLHLYTADQQRFALETLKKFCAITGSTYLLRNVASPKHVGDKEVLLYRADGKLVATLDGDLYPDVTGTVDASIYLVLAGVLATLSAAAFVFLRRRATDVA